jgi:tetratricopeptide (TPR) repeat protein
MTTLRCVLPLLLVSLATAPVWSADAPTAEEWTPVEQALNEDAPDAPAKLSALVNTYPKWSDGRRTLAQLLLRQGKAEAALTEAKLALTLAPTDATAAAVAVQAYGALSRPAEAYAIADQFVGDKDPQGWVNFRAAEVALGVGDRAKADLHLSLANGRAKKNPPAEFAYLDARISAAAGDLDRAELSLNRAVGGNPRLWDAWYELGVVQLRQAEAKTASTRREYLEKAIASFTKVTAIHNKDAHAWLGLGRAQVTLAQHLSEDRADEGRALAAKAAASLKNAIEINSDLRDAHLNLGVALLMGDDHEGAITHLLKARDLGSTSRTLGFNLMLAYQKAGRTAEFEAEARNVQAVSTAEKLTAGIGFFRAGNHALAAELLISALPDLGEDRERVASTYRFIGHAHAATAEAMRAKPGNDPAAIEAALDRAREAYRKAGNLRDFPAQRYFMAQETARSPDAGYAAGWQQLAWNGYTTIDGWSAVVGNYGGAVTGGQGIVGMWQRNPIHVVVWGVLAFLPLLLAMIAFLRPKRVEEDDHSERDRRPVSEPIARPTTRPPATKAAPAPAPAPKASNVNNRSPVTKPPQASAKQRTPVPPATIPAAKPVPVAKNPTPRPKVRSPIETDPSMTPLGNVMPKDEPRARMPETDHSLRPAKAPEKQVRTSGEFAALERRTPRPEDGKKP